MSKPTFEEATDGLVRMVDAIYASHRARKQADDLSGMVGIPKELIEAANAQADALLNEYGERLDRNAALIAGGSIIDGEFVAEGSEHHD